MDSILVGLEKVASLIDRCTVYELLYLHVGTAASQNLERSILRLYTKILKFLARAILRLKGEGPDSAVLSALLTASQKVILRQFSLQKKYPMTCRMLKIWRKLLGSMQLQQKLNVGSPISMKGRSLIMT